MLRLGCVAVLLAAAFSVCGAGVADSAGNLVGGWHVASTITKGSCLAKIAGPQVDTLLMASKDGRLILVAAWPGRELPTGAQQGSLAIDDAPPEPVEVQALAMMALYPVKDDTMEARLAKASVLQWHFAWGDFRADVTGLGLAAEALRTCNKD